MDGSLFMGKILVRIGLILIILILVLAIGNPREDRYLNEISNHYGHMHGGMQFSPAELLEMGESHRESYLIFSTYEYRFGSIGVKYLGVGFGVFYMGSFRKDVPETNEDEDGVIVLCP